MTPLALPPSDAHARLVQAFDQGDVKGLRAALAQVVAQPWSLDPEQQRALVLALHDEIQAHNTSLLPLLTPLWDRLDAPVRKALVPLVHQATLKGDAPAVASLLPYVGRWRGQADWLKVALAKNHLAVMAVLLPVTRDLTCGEVLEAAVKDLEHAEAVRLLLTRNYPAGRLHAVMLRALDVAYEESEGGLLPEHQAVVGQLVFRVDLDTVAAELLTKNRSKQLGGLQGLVAPTQMRTWLDQSRDQRGGRLHPDLVEVDAWVRAQERQTQLTAQPTSVARRVRQRA